MAYVVNESCIKCKYMDCVEVCPVDCFYEGENMLVINPAECIDCGVCEPECPTDAIVFGNMNDPNSRVSKRKATERDYQVLADLNYRPRTTYTAGVINPNAELA